MGLGHLLIHLDSTERALARLDVAVALAGRFGAVLTAVFAESDHLGLGLVTMRDPARMEAALVATRAAFEAKVSAAHLPSEWWQVDRGDYGHTVGWIVRCCRYSDMAILGRHIPGESRVPADLVEQVMLGSGRPVLVLPPVWRPTHVGNRVLIAWTGSREAARAVNDAIPLMDHAERVLVLSLQTPGDEVTPRPPLDIVAHLNAHGIPAAYERSILEADSPVEVLLRRAEQLDVDLLVMGGHRAVFPSAQLSRTTREVMRSAACPLLLSH